MTSIPEPNAILATLRERGHAGLPDVDIRIGASVLDEAIKDSTSLSGAPVIMSDGGPYRTPTGPVVDRLAEQLGDGPVIQLGTGTVRADKETVERAVLTGPAVAIPGFVDQLAAQLHMPVEAAVVATEAEGADARRLTVAAGLALADTP